MVWVAPQVGLLCVRRDQIGRRAHQARRGPAGRVRRQHRACGEAKPSRILGCVGQGVLDIDRNEIHARRLQSGPDLCGIGRRLLDDSQIGRGQASVRVNKFRLSIDIEYHDRAGPRGLQPGDAADQTLRLDAKIRQGGDVLPLQLQPDQVVAAIADHVQRVGIGNVVHRGQVIGHLGDDRHVVVKPVHVGVCGCGGDCLRGPVCIVGAAAARDDEWHGGQAEPCRDELTVDQRGPGKRSGSAGRNGLPNQPVDRRDRSTGGQARGASGRVVAEISAVHAAITKPNELVESRCAGRAGYADSRNSKKSHFANPADGWASGHPGHAPCQAERESMSGSAHRTAAFRFVASR